MRSCIRGRAVVGNVATWEGLVTMPSRFDRGFRFPLQKYDDSRALFSNFKYIQEYLNYIRKKDIHSDQLVVAAVDTANPHMAHIQCDGTADDAAITAAIAALDANDVSIVLLDGNYSFTDAVDGGSKNIAVRGTAWPHITVVDDGFTSTGDSSYEGLEFSGGASGGVIIANRSEAGLFIVSGCKFDGITAKACVSPNDGSSADAENFFAVYGNVFADVTVAGGGGASPRGVIWMDAASSQTFNGSVFGNRFEDCAGGDLFQSNSSKRVMIYGNVIQSCTVDTNEATYFHNWIDGVFTAGEHSLALGDLSDVGVGTPTSGNIILADGDSWESTPGTEYVADIVGGMVTGNTETGITVTYDDTDNTLDFAVTTLALGDLTDVGVGTPTAGNLLEADGDSWESVTPGSMDAADFGSGAGTDNYVLTADGIGGAAWEVLPAGGAHDLDSHTDVTLTTPADNNLLAYDSGTTQWIDQTLAEAGHDTHDHSTALGTAILDDLSDVTEWTTWSPSLTNLTVGNGTTTARYAKIGKTVHFMWWFALGSTSAVGTSPTISLPVTLSSAWPTFAHIGTAYIQAAGTQYIGFVGLTSTTVMRPLSVATAGASGTIATLSATAPGTFTTSDDIILVGTYEAA
jgi:hypothetical protein